MGIAPCPEDLLFYLQVLIYHEITWKSRDFGDFFISRQQFSPIELIVQIVRGSLLIKGSYTFYYQRAAYFLC